MKSHLTLLVTLLGAFCISSCSHSSVACSGTCVNNNATLNVTMSAVPLTPPPGTSILSYGLTVTGIALSPTTGSDISIALNATTLVMDATRLQSDSAVLGQVRASVPAGTYNKVTLAISSASVTFCTQSNPGTPGCSNGSVATVVANPRASTPASALSLTLAANEQAGLRLQLNMAQTLTINGQVVTALNLAPATATPVPVLSAVTLPPVKSSLASGQLDFVEDFTGIVTAISGSAVTLTTSQHGAITALANSTTSFSPNCLNAGIGTAEDLTCVKSGQLASIDTVINADGTFTLLEYDPLEANASDWIEGTVTSVPASTTQFQIVANDMFLKAAGSIIGSNMLVGAPVNVNLATGAKFAVDTKGQNVPLADSANFASSNDTSVLKPGQTVAVRVTSFTPAAGSTFAIATSDSIDLRFTRVSGSVALVAAPNSFSIQNLPPYFGTTTARIVQLNQIVFPSGAATNYDGITSASDLNVNDIVSIRALYFPTSATQPFSAAKVRKQ